MPELVFAVMEKEIELSLDQSVKEVFVFGQQNQLKAGSINETEQKPFAGVETNFRTPHM
jgi:hypothetical protein